MTPAWLRLCEWAVQTPGTLACLAKARHWPYVQIPAAAIDGNVRVIFPPGSYIDVDVLLSEIQLLKLAPEQIHVSPLAHVITEEHRAWELQGKLPQAIGSTGSGTGAAVLARTARGSENFPLVAVKAEDVSALRRFVTSDTTAILRDFLNAYKRIVIEGTQGFGLSLLHAEHWPKATSRDTTAAGFIAETGLSPLDVDDVTMVIRCHPNSCRGRFRSARRRHILERSGPRCGAAEDLREFTTVTHKVRRVGRFDASLVRKAIAANRPSRVVLNHLDYVDCAVRSGLLTAKAGEFVEWR